ncbi:MAG TPA: hypothetical protein VFQ54_01595 [Thermomicrobiales bacterium]|nr:hypothetical protein [Thermomicrobiales bacterium]
MAEITRQAFNPNEHLMKLKGKDYLEVKWRLVWFRQEYPHGRITTAIHQITDTHAIVTAQVDDGVGGTGSGIGSESVKDFGDFIEKAETKAIGRALAALGFGTQFAPELEEGERIVDSPVARPQSTPARPRTESPAPKATDQQRNFIIGLGKQLGMVKADGHHDGEKLDQALSAAVGTTLADLSVPQAKEAIDRMKKKVAALPKATGPAPVADLDGNISHATRHMNA